MHYVYVLKSSTKKWFYVGCTSDLRKRLAQHINGQVKTTKGYRPLSLKYYEAYETLTQARCREFELKHNSQQKEFVMRRITHGGIA